MKKVYLVGMGMFFLSCAFTRGFVKRKHDKYTSVAEYMIKNKLSQLTKENVTERSVKKLMTELKIDVAIDGNQGNQYGHEPKDSVIVFINHGSFFFGKYKKVFYDYSKVPRQFSDTSNTHNDYMFKKVADRFYISSQKTDR